jgi:hypothetical protein
MMLRQYTWHGNKAVTLSIDRATLKEYSSATIISPVPIQRTVLPNQSEDYSENKQEVYNHGKIPDPLGTG